MNKILLVAASLLLIGAGCGANDQAVADQFVDPPQTRAYEDFEQADKDLVLDRYLTPGSDLIPNDVTGGCAGIEPFDQRKYLGASILVWKLTDGRCYPHMQFTYRSDPDLCDENHYHLTVMSVDGHVREDSQPCGSVVASEVVESSVNVSVSPWQYMEISKQFTAFRGEE